jgi:hypothetical protein
MGAAIPAADVDSLPEQIFGGNFRAAARAYRASIDVWLNLDWQGSPLRDMGQLRDSNPTKGTSLGHLGKAAAQRVLLR